MSHCPYHRTRSAACELPGWREAPNLFWRAAAREVSAVRVAAWCPATACAGYDLWCQCVLAFA